MRLRRARVRRGLGQTLIEGPHLLDMAVRHGAVVEKVFALEDDGDGRTLAKQAKCILVTVTQDVLDRLAPTTHPRGPVAVIRVPSPRELEQRHTLAIAGVSDPGNAGTLMRTAAALDLQVCFTEGSADPWSPKVLRAAAGANFLAPPVALGSEPVQALREAELTVVASVATGGEPPAKAFANGRYVAILVGCEGSGLDPELIDQADTLVTIPMPGGTESLNAAVAGAILGWELVRLGHEKG